MAYPTIAELVERSKETAKTHKPVMSGNERRARGIKMSATLVLACVDPRSTPEHIFDLKPTEVIVHRSAAGNVSSAIEDILALDVLVGLDEIMVIHHTDCGCLRYSNESMRKEIISRIGPEHADVINAMDFGAITDVEESTKSDIAWLKQSPLLRKELSDRAQGYVYDVVTAELRRVA
ncbi:hypothetical protein AYL99_01080 [Fonsecaea erecta]|uniref:Carbonic anhydrase n=1 Tax=Fonsecaea erecta TaxID=1367422 RepID=A0A178ZZ51_9EURO|nr:hypothetical protein AYL99_01080 [Fonsecaea erecta]OAP65108.1 hypothetical protein AYL99_01080 [Fonsecaea erecta]